VRRYKGKTESTAMERRKTPAGSQRYKGLLREAEFAGEGLEARVGAEGVEGRVPADHHHASGALLVGEVNCWKYGCERLAHPPSSLRLSPEIYGGLCPYYWGQVKIWAGYGITAGAQ
jgi:hypothetical protein